LTLLGLHHYNRAFPNDETILGKIKAFATDLVNNYRSEASDDWRWYEPYLTYANPRLPQSLYASYLSIKEPEYLQIANNSLDFIIQIQIIDGLFIPIGTERWYKKNEVRAIYDQQPIEASCIVEAAAEAFKITGEEKYLDAAQTAFEWFHGKNTQNVTLYNAKKDTCHDGVTPNGLNQNQGAESTLSYYMAYLTLRSIDVTYSAVGVQ